MNNKSKLCLNSQSLLHYYYKDQHKETNKLHLKKQNNKCKAVKKMFKIN